MGFILRDAPNDKTCKVISVMWFSSSICMHQTLMLCKDTDTHCTEILTNKIITFRNYTHFIKRCKFVTQILVVQFWKWALLTDACFVSTSFSHRLPIIDWLICLDTPTASLIDHLLTPGREEELGCEGGITKHLKQTICSWTHSSEPRGSRGSRGSAFQCSLIIRSKWGGRLTRDSFGTPPPPVWSRLTEHLIQKRHGSKIVLHVLLWCDS